MLLFGNGADDLNDGIYYPLDHVISLHFLVNLRNQLPRVQIIKNRQLSLAIGDLIKLQCFLNVDVLLEFVPK